MNRENWTRNRTEVSCPLDVLANVRYQVHGDPNLPAGDEGEIRCYTEEIEARPFFHVEQCFPIDPEVNPELAEFDLCAGVWWRPGLEPTDLSEWNSRELVHQELIVRRRDPETGDYTAQGTVECIHIGLAEVPVPEDQDASAFLAEEQEVFDQLVTQLEDDEFEGTPLQVREFVKRGDTGSITPGAAFAGFRTWVAGQTELPLFDMISKSTTPRGFGWNYRMHHQMQQAFRSAGIDDIFQQKAEFLAQEHTDWFIERDNAGLFENWEVQPTPQLCSVIADNLEEARGDIGKTCKAALIKSGKPLSREQMEILVSDPENYVVDTFITEYLYDVPRDLQEELVKRSHSGLRTAFEYSSFLDDDLRDEVNMMRDYAPKHYSSAYTSEIRLLEPQVEITEEQARRWSEMEDTQLLYQLRQTSTDPVVVRNINQQFIEFVEAGKQLQVSQLVRVLNAQDFTKSELREILPKLDYDDLIYFIAPAKQENPSFFDWLKEDVAFQKTLVEDPRKVPILEALDLLDPSILGDEE